MDWQSWYLLAIWIIIFTTSFVCLIYAFVLAELLRENKRMLDKSIREIERERQGLQTQEKKLITEIKKSAKQGQMVSIHSFLV